MHNLRRLNHPLYGLQESGTYWYSSLKAQLQNNGFRPTVLDSAFLRHETNEGVADTVVDDIITCGLTHVMETEAKCAEKFKNKLRVGSPLTISGTLYCQRVESMLISQNTYIKNMSAGRKGGLFQELRGQLSYVAHAVHTDCLATASLSSRFTKKQF
ncbi:hypothetical protein FVE85_5151 [Porphyridium purpureum]|uniref:Uncharacterized protein n=1 Tax=Porphyridium purpureum TaxID=35688 RepID=A0A5J4Z1R5_PORPP|nr:hypothetical protein FVE85_5151 [Porphyridium purpureum]|eukprot:POR9866..scf295_1